MGSSDPVVLIVEDEPDVAETYRLWLEEHYEVRLAASGDEGVDALDESIDVVLLDRMMPGLSGDDVLDFIRTEQLDCRVAMVTAVEPDFDILEMGFDTYLSKPVKSQKLKQAVANLLERSTYDSIQQEYYALIEKRATLEASKHTTSLERSDEYDELTRRIDELREELEETLGGIDDDDDFIETIRSVGDGY